MRLIIALLILTISCKQQGETLTHNQTIEASATLTLLDVTHKNKLGFNAGVDMREETLELLTNDNLLSNNIWLDKNLNGLLLSDKILPLTKM